MLYRSFAVLLVLLISPSGSWAEISRFTKEYLPWATAYTDESNIFRETQTFLKNVSINGTLTLGASSSPTVSVNTVTPYSGSDITVTGLLGASTSTTNSDPDKSYATKDYVDSHGGGSTYTGDQAGYDITDTSRAFVGVAKAIRGVSFLDAAGTEGVTFGTSRTALKVAGADQFILKPYAYPATQDSMYMFPGAGGESSPMLNIYNRNGGVFIDSAYGGLQPGYTYLNFGASGGLLLTAGNDGNQVAYYRADSIVFHAPLYVTGNTSITGALSATGNVSTAASVATNTITPYSGSTITLNGTAKATSFLDSAGTEGMTFGTSSTSLDTRGLHALSVVPDGVNGTGVNRLRFFPNDGATSGLDVYDRYGQTFIDSRSNNLQIKYTSALTIGPGADLGLVDPLVFLTPGYISLFGQITVGGVASDYYGRIRALKGICTNSSTPINLSADGAGTGKLTIPDASSAHRYRVDVAMFGTAGTKSGKAAAFTIEFLAKNVGGTVTQVGSSLITTVADDAGGVWSADVGLISGTTVNVTTAADAGSTVTSRAFVTEVGTQ